tara:strand:- start:1231 stop:1413 length:183 start_codon:yes stop_codon:yes gene_type:complete
MMTDKRIREVMSKNHCDYSTACSWLGKRSGEARRGRARAEARREDLLARQRAQMAAMGID